MKEDCSSVYLIKGDFKRIIFYILNKAGDCRKTKKHCANLLVSNSFYFNILV